jgi:hypothetical protein
MASINMKLIIIAAQKAISDAKEALQELEKIGKTNEEVYRNLASSEWSMSATIEAYQNGTLNLADPDHPDSVPLDQEMVVAMALNAPLQSLRASLSKAQAFLAGGTGL